MNIPENVRAYIYRIVLALAPIAVYYGIVTEEAIGLIVGAIAAILGVGLAVLNTTTKKDDDANV